MKKIKSQSELLEILEKERSLGKKIGFTNGCFDILHTGHVRYLTAAREACDILVVGVNSDGSVKQIKGDERPINNSDARMEVLSALESVDFLTLFEEETPEKLIGALLPNILFKGGDWKEEDVVGAVCVKENGGEVKIIPYVTGFSTTDIINKMKK
ncbi:MAG: D-glycero-beta-D-manno-heptose 1-phosphate adenylyltransferase [Candidatus Omnitrophica bacterium]|nr:D-glycero-beta-D-manno-heptose 1-phosphate adenylyltransferase [Candidatus Omnitrophota bacterium]